MHVRTARHPGGKGDQTRTDGRTDGHNGDGEGEREDADVGDEAGGDAAHDGGREERGVAERGGVDDDPVHAHEDGREGRELLGRPARVGAEEAAGGELLRDLEHAALEEVHDGAEDGSEDGGKEDEEDEGREGGADGAADDDAAVRVLAQLDDAHDAEEAEDADDGQVLGDVRVVEAQRDVEGEDGHHVDEVEPGEDVLDRLAHGAELLPRRLGTYVDGYVIT